LIEIRFHGMGGQGAVMGALILAEAAFSEGKYAQKIPMYGGARRGGDVTVFLRLDDRPIRRTSGIYEPDSVVILDPTLKKQSFVRAGIKTGGTAILNDELWPRDIDLGVKLGKTATLDATGISAEVFGVRAIPVVNTPMLGAIAKATSWVKLESLAEPIKHQLPGKVGDLNVKACQRGWEAVKEA
jgi:2-oxoacid:acceptor oxidoreductase gamma subunit (pyruvate/2-ketoisovalerate family)